MPDTLKDKDWNRLLTRIQKGTCTPFLGAGTCYGVLPLGGDIAKEWSDTYKYPIVQECKDLIKVSQFLAITEDPAYPRERIIEIITDKIKKGVVPNFDDPNEPHNILADLPLPIYITTNYDDFMFRALENRKKKPTLELCRWKRSLKDYPSVFDIDPGYVPSPATPIVYHLHGFYKEEASLVITEDDYLDFIVNISQEATRIPATIWKALRSTSILFLGYKIADWNFRVLLRGLVRDMGVDKKHVSVQLVPGDDDDTEEQKQKVQQYLDSYYENIKTHVYWGPCQIFAEDLKKRWEGFK